MMNLSTIIVFVILVIICVFAATLCKKKSKGGCCGCGNCSSRKEFKTLVYIDGMHCTHCSSTVEEAFEEINCNARVNLEEKYAEVYSSGPLDEKEISEMINSLGFTFVKME